MTSDYSRTTRGERDLGEQKDTASKVKDQAQQKVGEVAAQAQQKVGEVAAQAQQTVTSGISTQKDTAAQSLSGVAQALRQTGQQLRDQDQSGVTGYIEQAAEQVERLSTYLERNDLGHLVGDIERFARRQPALFLGGAFLVGLLGARFLRSTRPNQYDDSYAYRSYTSIPGDTYGGYRGIYGSGMGGAYSPGSGYGTYGTGGGHGPTGTYSTGDTSASSGTVESDRIPGVYSSPTDSSTERTNQEQTRTRAYGEPLEE